MRRLSTAAVCLRRKHAWLALARMGEAMGAIGLAEAARLTGRNQSSIHRAMKAGRLSYTKNEAGERRIDVAELERFSE